MNDESPATEPSTSETVAETAALTAETALPESAPSESATEPAEAPPTSDVPALSESVAEGAPASAAEAVSDAEVAPVPDEKPAKKPRTRKKKGDEDEATEHADEAVPTAEAPALTDTPAAENKKHWYIIKVTSNREESIKSNIERRVKIEGLEEYFGQIVIPVERITQVKKVTEKKKDTGEKVTKEKRVIKENKKYPGYLFAEVEFNDRILYLFRETSGVGDFVGASLNRAPTPMPEREVMAMLTGIVDPKDKKGGGKTVVKLDFEKGDKVRIREGAFANSEGEVKLITEPKDASDTPKVTVEVTIWGRPVPVELDYWQVDKV